MVGLSSSIGKDIVPRVAGYFSAQPISDIVEIAVELNIFRVKIFMFDQHMLEMLLRRYKQPRISIF